MVREILTVDWCDLCMRDGERERVEESHRLVIDGKSFNVDLCANHLGEFKAFVDLVTVASASHTESTAKASSGKHGNHERHCLLCSYSGRNSGALSKHAQYVHGLDNAGDMFGYTCPLCEHEAATGQGAGLHARNAHREQYPEVVDIPTSFTRAAANGDPLGVVARARKAATKASQRALAKREREQPPTAPTLEGV